MVRSKSSGHLSESRSNLLGPSSVGERFHPGERLSFRIIILISLVTTTFIIILHRRFHPGERFYLILLITLYPLLSSLFFTIGFILGRGLLLRRDLVSGRVGHAPILRFPLQGPFHSHSPHSLPLRRPCLLSWSRSQLPRSHKFPQPTSSTMGPS